MNRQGLGPRASSRTVTQSQEVETAIGQDAAADHQLERVRRNNVRLRGKFKVARSAPYPATTLFRSSASDPGSPLRS